MAGIALALGAGGLVASGYLAARVQLGAGAERTPVLVSAAPANVAVETSRGAVMAAPVETSAHGEAAPAQAAPVQLPHEAQPARSAPQRGSSRAEVRRERQHRKPKAVAVVPEVPAAANAPEPSDVETLAPPEPEPNSAAQEQTASEPPARVEAPAAEAADSPPVLTIKPLPADSAPSALGVSQQLTREQVRDAMLAAREQLAQCVGDKHGTSYASVTIEGSGRVSYSLIEGAFAGTSTGSCMARVLRGVMFPSSSGSAFKVRYPLVF
jgi:hypothetical protein